MSPNPVLLHGLSPDEVARVAALSHPDPHHVLGAHPAPDGVIVRALRPDAAAMRVRVDDTAAIPMEPIDPHGMFGAFIKGATLPLAYELETNYGDGFWHRQRDAYAFPPTLGAVDVHLAAEGKHLRLWDRMGAHVRTVDGVAGVTFAVWAPNARRVSVVGDWNGWDGRVHAMRRMGATGLWELFIPHLAPGQHYKYEIVQADGAVRLKLDPFAFQTQLRPETAGVVVDASAHRWGDAAWLEKRAKTDLLRAPMSVYEVHLGSWMRVAEEGNRWMTYRELAPKLADYVAELGFTHVELLPVAEHPFDGSWGYQVTGYYAPTSRFGTPDDFRYLVDHLHERNIGVLLDWVPAHFPRDAFALARYDGTAVYEHADPRQGEHPDWGTLIFNYGRNEVKNFLVANALYWLEEFHIDGLRVDAVAAMLYLDYSRKQGEWVPNVHGGRENLEAIAFLRELNEVVHAQHPGAMVIAEESTAWPAVSRPVYTGGLGFTFKWNMGWMHDTLKYFSLDPIHRRFHHNHLTFGFLYAWSENFMLPISHDEVVHLKGSLLGKMPGDRWQKFANLRALLAYMWAHPGKKLLFMGSEIGTPYEWNHDAQLAWELLGDPFHAGVQALMKDLNAVYRSHDALWDGDVDPQGFRWIDANDSEQSVASFLRLTRDGKRAVVCVLNATPIVRHKYRIGVPVPGTYREVLNTDGAKYGGSNVGNHGQVASEPVAWHGHAQSIVLTLPPLGMLLLEAPERPAEPAAVGAGAATARAASATASTAASATPTPGSTATKPPSSGSA